MKDVVSLERDIEQSRAELAGTLRALESRLSFFRVIDEVIAMTSSRPTRDIVRDHALPLGVIGIGVGWLAVRALAAPETASPRESTVEKVFRDAGEMAKTAGEAVETARERVGLAAKTAGEAVDGVRERAETLARTAGRSAGEFATDMKERGEGGAAMVGTLLREHPLAVGVFAAVAGAALGALVPAARNGQGASGKTKH